MRRIIIVGKLDKMAEELYKRLSTRYKVLFCTETGKVLQDMVRIVKPHLVILNVAQKKDISWELFEFFHNFYLFMPVLVLGEKEDCERGASYYDGETIIPVYRPVTIREILDKCTEALEDVRFEREEENENPPKEEAAGPKNILVVDDSAFTLRNMKSLLEDKYKVSLATSGEMALKMIQLHLPDLILLDYEMPGRDGKETLELIRKNENSKDIPVIFLTGVADEMRIKDILNLNPAGYLLKPVKTNRLLQSIEEALEE